MSNVTYLNGEKLCHSTLFEVILILYLLHNYVPIIGFYMPSMVYMALFLLLYVVSAYQMRFNRFFYYTVKVMPLFCLAIFELFFDLLTKNIGFVAKDLYGIAQTIILPILALYFLDTNNVKIAKRILVVVALCYVVTAITTYFGCIAFPNAARNLATDIRSENLQLYSTYMRLNIGGFDFIYTLILALPLIICLFKNKLINSTMMAIIVIPFGMAIIESEYTTALLLLVLCIFVFFIPKDLNTKKIFRYMLLLVVIAIALMPFLSSFIQYIADNSSSEQVASRLNDLASSISGEGVQSNNSDLEARQDAFKISWNTFVNTFFLGGWSHSVIGGHSYYLDALARFGILALIFLIISYRRLYNLFFAPMKKRSWYWYALVVLLISVVLAFLNTRNNFAFITFILPMFYLVVGNKKRSLGNIS